MILALLAALVAAGAQARPAAGPSLELTKTRPLEVHGYRFKARELVKLRLSGAATGSHTVRTSSSGAFAATFSDVSLSRCDSAMVSAIGSRGDRAEVHYVPVTACSTG